jgi:pyridoxine 5-phosphate synthase
MRNRSARLGVNIDHVATLRRLRDTPYPDILAAAQACIDGGADQITVHLREDRRHIVDQDVLLLKKCIGVDLNLEMAVTQAMAEFALGVKPHSICLVPEKREERTTEGGLDLSRTATHSVFNLLLSECKKAKILVSLFIEPTVEHVSKAADLGAPAVELHTGALCIALQNGDDARAAKLLDELKEAVEAGVSRGLLVHAGHGIDYSIAPRLAVLDGIAEFNIGHAIICQSVFDGLSRATQKMKAALSVP